MFEYVLIGTEVLTLLGVFWYVFIREPKPFELKENLWGIYDPAMRAYTVTGGNQARAEEVVYAGGEAAQEGCTNYGANKSQALIPQMRAPNPKNGWVYVEKPRNHTVSSNVGLFITNVGSLLTQLGGRLS